MAGTLTHQKFAIDMLDKLKECISNKELYMLACQGHDLGMFSKWYNLPLRNKTHEFVIQKLTKYYFAEYIFEYINYIKNNDLYLEDDVRIFIYGYISHHYLDVYTHPYIIYESGNYYLDDPDTKKYAGKHNIFETQIDKVILDDFYNNQKIHKCFPRHVKISNNIIKTNMEAFKNVYGNEYFGKLFVEAMNDVYPFMKLFRNDDFHIKAIFYELVDKILLERIKTTTRVDFLSFNFNNPITNNFLTENRTWLHPVSGEEYMDSFWELYNQALDFCSDLIIQLEKIITDPNRDAKEIYSILPNLSATTGKECNLQLKLKYFKN